MGTPSEKTMTSEAFKEELEDAPTTFDRDSLIQLIKQRVPQDEYLAQPKSVDIPAGLGPYFYKLPRELRDQIFAHLLASGYLDFMRTSRAMKQEGETRIAKEGVYRMNSGFDNGIHCQKPSQEVVATIQNVHIRIAYSTRGSDPDDSTELLEFLDLFAGPAPHRQTCNVSFESHGKKYFVVGYELLSRLQRLRGFEKVVLRTSVKWPGSISMLAVWPDRRDDLFNKDLLKVWRSHFEFQAVRTCLVPHLGETEITSVKDDSIMVFYPRKVQQLVPVVGSAGNSRNES